AAEADALASLISDHPDLSSSGVFELYYEHVDSSTEAVQLEASDEDNLFTFPDGSELELLPLSGVDASFDATPAGWGGRPDEGVMRINVTGPDGDSFNYLEISVWQSVNNEIESAFQNVRDGIDTWVTNVYGEVQSGEIEISSLITPRDRAEMLSEEETEAQAISDLAALNIPIDPQREATITITETGATLSGTIGLTDESDGPIESGETYDPSTFAGDVYFTTDVSQLSGSWDGYNSGVDGGTITLTSQPYEGTVYNVTTTAGETVSVPASDWTDNGDGTWSYDASGELDTTTTEVESVSYESADDQTQYETLLISKEFTVDKLTNKETGEEASSASFDSSEPQDDSNYISQEEWNQLEEQNQELIEKYEESQNTGGAGAGWFGDGSPDVGLIAAVVGGAGVVYALFGQEDN
ncbi:hypothetical protein, partial [Halorubrum sp. Atlit-26R]|uniref:hypothetical protein n=1 Tax=Halorubrum sp. Atlit-26R TaxID=2282128 RepID=UPI00131464C6